MLSGLYGSIISVGSIEVFLEMLHLLTLHTLEGPHSLEHLVPVDQCSVEFRSINADKLSLSANGQSACSAHSRTVHHDGVERHVCRNAVLLSEQAAELHHYRRSDGKSLVYVRLLLYEFLDTYRYDTFLAV